MYFKFFKIQFHKRQEAPAGQTPDFSAEIDDFSSHFFHKLNAYIDNPKAGELPIFYDNQVFPQLDGQVILMRLCNNRKVSKVVNYEKLYEDTNPFCHVIFDLRPDRLLLAIERSPAFSSDCDKVRDLLTEFFHNLIDGRRGYNVRFNPLMRAVDFWDFVDERLAASDRITKVDFCFPDARKTQVLGNAELIAKMQFLRQLAVSTNAIAAQYTLEAEPTAQLRIERVNEDLTQMVDLCLRNAYNISLHFRDRGLCRTLTDMGTALFSLKNEARIDEFIKGQTAMSDDGETSFALVFWLDYMHNELIKSQYDTPETDQA